MKDNLNILVKKANSGDRNALELVLIEIEELVYNLSLKMLLFPEDAKDIIEKMSYIFICYYLLFNATLVFPFDVMSLPRYI